MAKPSALLFSLFLLFLTMAALSDGGLVGGRTEIKDVKSNKEIQDLGKYAVGEYNARANGRQLTFSAVAKAEKQLVSGIKYYLRIQASEKDGVSKNFDAVVIVMPWIKYKQLLRFVRSTN